MISSYNDYILNDLVAQIVSMYQDIDEGLIIKPNLVEVGSDDVGHYLATKTTCKFDLFLDYSHKSENGSGTIIIEIPRMIAGLFVIKGKFRVPTINLLTDSEGRSYWERFILNKFMSIEKGDKVFEYYDYDEDDTKRVDVIKIDTVPEDWRRIDENLSKKLAIKYDLDYYPEIVDEELANFLISTEPDTTDDFILDKKLTTVETLLARHIGSRSGSSFLYQAKSNYYRALTSSGVVSIYSKGMQSRVDRFFRMQSNITLSLNVPSAVNPISFDSLKTKVMIPSNVAYNGSMVDLIDVVNTPENNNVNKINHLNKCTKIIGGESFIECYDKQFNKVLVKYIDYLDSVVIKSSAVDYLGKRIKLDSVELPAKKRLKNITTTLESADYIDASPDDKLSVSTRRIPFVNYSDSVRIAMGASMIGQGVELSSPEEPLVSAGTEDKDSYDNSLAVKFQHAGGIVKSIEGKYLTISSGEKDHIYTIPSPITSINDVSINFSVKVKVGDTVNNGEVIITPSSLKRSSFNMGLNAKIAFMPYRGYNNEDGLVVSESFAKKMSHYSVIDLEIKVSNTDVLDGMTPIGSRVSSQDELVSCFRKLSQKEVSKALVDSFQLPRFSDLRNKSLKVPNNIENAIIADIVVIKGDLEPTEHTRKAVNDFETNYDRSDAKGKIPNRMFHRLLDSDTDLELDECSAVIKVRLVMLNHVKVGDKITNRYGSKGVVSLIEPDEKMPKLVGTNEIVDCVMNPYSIISRKNISQTLEMYCGNISEHFYSKASALIESNSLDFEALEAELSEFYGDKFSNMGEDEFLRLMDKIGVRIFAMSVGAFSDLTPETIMEWMSKLGLASKFSLVDGRSGRPIKNKVVVGSQYLIKLYHLPEYYDKVTPKEKSKTPVLGKGTYRSLGQKIGEQEMWSLSSYGMTKYLNSIRTDEYEDNYSFLNNMLMLGMTVKNHEKEDEDFSSKLKQLKDKLEG